MKPWKKALLAWQGTGNNLAYTNKVKALSPIAYWPLADASGVTATDASGNARNGAYSNVTLGATGVGDGRTAATFNGTTSVANIYSASLDAAKSLSEGTAAMWVKVSAAGVWSDSTTRQFFMFLADSANNAQMFKTGGANAVFCRYVAGNTTKTVSLTVSATTWIHFAITWSKTADEFKAYLNGAQSGSTQTALGTISNTVLSSTQTCIGAASTSPSVGWSGDIAHAAVWATPLSAAQILTLATVP